MSESDRPVAAPPHDGPPDPEAAMHDAMDAYRRSIAAATAATARSSQAVIDSARAVKRRISSGQLAAVKLPPR